MKTRIICVTDNDKHWKEPINEYCKRLNNLEVINLKPEKKWDINTIINKETEKIISKIEKTNDYIILLDINWEDLDSHEFSNIIIKNNTTFIIWWPYWLNKEIINNKVNKKISFWRATMPHWLAKLVLIEQIYRANTIITWKKYHY